MHALNSIQVFFFETDKEYRIKKSEKGNPSERMVRKATGLNS
jgi:hypothetical protein